MRCSFCKMAFSRDQVLLYGMVHTLKSRIRRLRAAVDMLAAGHCPVSGDSEEGCSRAGLTKSAL